MFQPLFLKIFYRGQLLKIRPFTEDQISVGSGEGLSLVLPGIAPWHILIEKKQDTYTVFDLGSESGTLLDGQKIAEEQEIQSGSFLTLGEYQIQFFVGPPPQMQPSPQIADPEKTESSSLPKAVGYSEPSSSKATEPGDVSSVPFSQKSRGAGENITPPQSAVNPSPAVKPPTPSVVSQAAPAMKPHSAPVVEGPPATPIQKPGVVTQNPSSRKLGVSHTANKIPSPSISQTVPAIERSPATPVQKPGYPQNLPRQKLRVGHTTNKTPSPSVVPRTAPVVGNPPSPPTQKPEEGIQSLPPQKLSIPSSAEKESPVSPVTSPTGLSISSADSPEETQSIASNYSENFSTVPSYKETVAPPSTPPPVKQAPQTPSFTPQQEPIKETVAPPPTPPPVKQTPQAPAFTPQSSAGVAPAVGGFQKPDKKGFWSTFAPPDKIKNLDEFLTPSIGNFIEVIVAWKNRILFTRHFSKGSIYMGSDEGCEVPVSNLMDLGKYKLLDIQETAQVCFQGVSGALIQGKERATRQIHPVQGNRNLILKPYEMIRLDFRNALKIYVRLKNKPTPAGSGKVFKFSVAEMSVLFFSFFLTGLLVFYSGIYAPLFLLEEEKFVEENIQKAVVKFAKQPPKPVDYTLKKKTQRAKKKAVAVKKKNPVPKKKKKRASLPSRVKKKTKLKKVALKALGRKKGKSSASTRGKKKKSAKVAVGSVRPGGSVKTGKSGATAKTVAPDPTKMGLLGVFGKGGKLKKLDQGATGSAAGGLVGLAEEATGHAGTRESYDGEGVGTRTKELVSGGAGTALVGISGIKVKGRGGSLKGMGSGGLGTRGRMNIDIGTDDLDVEGTIDRAAILRVIFKNHRRFDHCYQTSLQGNENLQGHLKMQWRILSKGRVKTARAIQDGVGSQSLANCVANVLKDLRFPVPPSGQIPRISFKFVFSK